MSHNICKNPSFLPGVTLSACSVPCAGQQTPVLAFSWCRVSTKKTFCLHERLAVQSIDH